MQSNDMRPLCRCGCGVVAHRDTGFARGSLPCKGSLEQQFWARVQKTDGCWLWVGQYKDRGGYGRFVVNGRRIRAHRFSWALLNGTVPVGQHVRHVVCDNPPCVRPDHLAPGTPTQNMADMRAKGRANYCGAGGQQARGERHGSAKLTEDDVREIRRLLAEGQPHRAIAARFGTSKGPIQGIALGRTWTHVA